MPRTSKRRSVQKPSYREETPPDDDTEQSESEDQNEPPSKKIDKDVCNEMLDAEESDEDDDQELGRYTESPPMLSNSNDVPAWPSQSTGNPPATIGAESLTEQSNNADRQASIEPEKEKGNKIPDTDQIQARIDQLTLEKEVIAKQLAIVEKEAAMPQQKIDNQEHNKTNPSNKKDDAIINPQPSTSGMNHQTNNKDKNHQPDPHVQQTDPAAQGLNQFPHHTTWEALSNSTKFINEGKIEINGSQCGYRLIQRNVLPDRVKTENLPKFVHRNAQCTITHCMRYLQKVLDDDNKYTKILEKIEIPFKVDPEGVVQLSAMDLGPQLQTLHHKIHLLKTIAETVEAMKYMGLGILLNNAVFSTCGNVGCYTSLPPIHPKDSYVKDEGQNIANIPLFDGEGGVVLNPDRGQAFRDVKKFLTFSMDGDSRSRML